MLVEHNVVKQREEVVSPTAKPHIGGSMVHQSIENDVIIESLPYGVMSFNITSSGDLIAKSANQLARKIFSIGSQNQLPCPFGVIWNSSENHLLAKNLREAATSPLPITLEWSMRVEMNEYYLVSHIQSIYAHEETTPTIICTIEDHTAEKLAEQNIMHHAFHDALTGQPNRVLFRNKLEEAVIDSEREGGTTGCAVLIINIDRFQQINESFGHSAGDRFLISMASTLRRCIGSSDLLARLSGDEFAVLMPGMNRVDSVEEVTERIHDAMRQPYDLDGNEVFTSVSIGVATTISSTTHPEDLIRDADFAMHRAKLAGKARTEVYRRDTHQRARSQFHLETELRRAVERGELELFYQPIIDLRTGKLHGFEALTRWHHKERGFVSPVEFIQLAEETGVIVPLGRWAMEAACTCIRQWADVVGIENAVPINVNVSGVQFARDDIAQVVEDTLKKHNLPGHLLRIELTESSIMANPGRISETLERIRSLGVKVALDDFGTGYSSLNYLHQFPIDIIKIDRSFINQLEQGNTQFMILEMIAMLASNLGHEVVAEGLEDTDHINMIADMGFHFAQGYYYSKPVRDTEAISLVKGDVPWAKHVTA